ncbi:MAG: amino acid adenylation domain-containing protein [Candidatus Aminicenantes bacterium]|nr:amino acid adenylation domain-containing protein [Candidatus Aminicenantes bacterium]NIM81637.1 amino acid adenylation domain-containing protein [Candidatus Aminicenantes bacterium]NIN21007.1 amino acid adenylation domain-containing protein [Candidatus Aminicenantes bacterium]NIN44828.1 amino acid adenylation domain-containing protein [Candidatus Aminicenantes bacterium]NIN87636.1 amino acid adenylation domain-containing protein [Candidatus Aminicenantes bacterium]
MINETFSVEKIDSNKGQFYEEKRYWEDVLCGINAAARFPCDSEIPEPGSDAQKGVIFSIPTPLVRQLHHIVDGSRLALFIILSIGLNYLLYLYTEEETIILGVPRFRRTDDEKAPHRWLPLKTRINGEMTFKDLLMEVKAVFSGALEHSHFFPLEEMLKCLDPSRAKKYPYFFDTGVALKDSYEDETAGALAAETLFLFEVTGDSIDGYIRYFPSLFNETTVRQWGDYLVCFLDTAVRCPGEKLKELEILSSEHKRVLLEDFNATRTHYPSDRSINELFEEMTTQQPDTIAVSFEDQFLTYRALDKRAGKLAAHLKEQGVGTETIVGIMIPPSVEVVIGLLGILKVGGAYLPIDADYPAARKQQLIMDTRVKWVLTRGESSAPAGAAGVDVMDSVLYKGEARCFPGKQSRPGHLAYVMYTSGSTGVPKGIMVEHRNVVRLIKNTTFIDFGSVHRVLQTGPLSFDASTFEIWGALLNGGRLHLADKSMLLSSESFKTLLLKYDIDTIWLTSALCNQNVDMDIHLFSTLRHLVVGGDVLSPHHIGRLRESFPALKMINGYGPTENTTFSATYTIEKTFHKNIPIGKPISNSFIYILNQYNRLVPQGVPGELCVGGDGVSRGYLNRPELTAEKFFLVSYRSHRSYRSYISSKKIYKTGDLARWLPDGNIEFLGRRDQQAKIRGFRIEPEEIEKELLKLEEVTEAAVLVKEKPLKKDGERIGGEKYLVAYFVPEGSLTGKDIRKKLVQRLPDYLIPTVFVPMAKLPLTSGGKIDRRSLPELDLSGLVDTWQVPETEMEAKLVLIWAEVLGIDECCIGIDDDFFELGGHSLKAAVFITRLHKELGIKVELTVIFENPTIREFARAIESEVVQQFHPIPPAEEKAYYSLSSAQKRLFILQQLDPGSTAYNVYDWVVLEEEIEKTNVEAVIRQLVTRHESLRTSFPTVERKTVQMIHDTIDIHVESLEGEPRRMIPRFIRPFNLTQAPLFRAGVERIPGHRTLLIFDMHHLITDGVSMDILAREFTALVEGKDLPPFKLQYRDYSKWQNSSEQQEAMKQQETYWLNLFADRPKEIRLPTDFPRPEVQSFEGKTIAFGFDRRETKLLNEIARAHSTTQFMVLLALYTVLLSKLSGQEDIVVGTAAAGRRHADLENIIGFFVNTLALRNYPTSQKTFARFLNEVKQNTLSAFDNQDYPFEELVEKISASGDISKTPMVNVFLNLVNQKERFPDANRNKNTNTDTEKTGRDFQEKENDHINIAPGMIAASHFDLYLAVAEIKGMIHLTFEYCTKLFKAERIEKFILYFRRIVAAVIDNPGIKLADIDILDDDDKNYLLETLRSKQNYAFLDYLKNKKDKVKEEDLEANFDF